MKEHSKIYDFFMDKLPVLLMLFSWGCMALVVLFLLVILVANLFGIMVITLTEGSEAVKSMGC